MTATRLEHVGIVVDDLDAATDFFVRLGLEPQSRTPVEGGWVDRLTGLEGVRMELVMLRSPDGQARVELAKFHAPPSPGGGEKPRQANSPGLRHVAFVVDDIEGVVARLQEAGGELVGGLERNGDRWRLGYVRGPEGIIVELAEQIG